MCSCKSSIVICDSYSIAVIENINLLSDVLNDWTLFESTKQIYFCEHEQNDHQPENIIE